RRRPPRPVPEAAAAGFAAVAAAAAGRALDPLVVLDRPRNAAPWRCATRYTDDSPIPKRLLISETGVSVSAYRRVTSRSCESLSLRRVVVAPSPCAPRAASPSEPESE